MSAIDWICLAVLLASLLMSVWRGLLYELMALAGWVLAFLAARWAAEPLALWLPMGQSPEGLRYAAAFVLVFIVVAFLCGMLAWGLRNAARRLGVRPVDRLFGAAFGALRGVAVLLLAAVLIGQTPLREQTWWRDSLSAPWLAHALLQLRPFLPEALGPYLSA